MDESLPEHHRLLLEAAQDQILEELDELLELPDEVPEETFIQRLVEDDKLRKEIQERFEHGKLSGKYTLLSRYVSHLPDEAKELFFISGWRRLAAPKKPWDFRPYNGNIEFYREELYGGKAFAATDLWQFAQEWLEELVRVGYRGVNTIGPFGLPLKQRVDDSAISTPASPPYSAAYRVDFDNTRQVLWLQLDGPKSRKHGYKEVRVADEPLRTDKAILAALTAMETQKLDVRRLRKALAELKLPLEQPMWKQWWEASKGFPFEQTLKGNRPELTENLQHHQTLDYVLLLLRHHRPEFDGLPHEQKLALIERTCDYVNEFLDVLHKLTAFLEYGDPGRVLRGAAEDADRDVRAAVLRDVNGLTYRAIGEDLSAPLPKNFHSKSDYPAVRQMVLRGRNVLERALGKEVWQQQIRVMKDEAKRWGSLSEVEQDAELLAECWGISYEIALQRAREEESDAEETRRSNDKPDSG